MFTCDEVQIQNIRYDVLVAQGRAMGEEHGRAAASWYFDGNTSDETYRAVLRGIEDGDPAILDTFPSSPLSGEWADDPTPASVLESLEIDPDGACADDVLAAYEDGFYSASSDEIERTCLVHLPIEEIQPDSWNRG